MEIFKKEDFEKLSTIEEPICISIYIPTHESGMEVNEGMDKLTLKSELQKIKMELKDRSIDDHFIDKILSPANDLINDNNFWRDQSQGLALFIKDNKLWSYRLPLSFETWSTISTMFDVAPLLPLINEDDLFYTLALSQNRVRLFKYTTFSQEEVDVSKLIPENMEEVLSFYDSSPENKDKNEVREGINRIPAGKARIPAQGPLPSHGGSLKDNEQVYLYEYLRKINAGITKLLENETAPLVVAAVDDIYASYKAVNTYQNLVEEYVAGNPDNLSEKDLFDKSTKLAKKQLTSTRRKDIKKYGAWAGTGKTSYDLETIVNAAHEGRIESLFILDEVHLWGKYDETMRKITHHKDKQPDDICLISLASSKTIENGGQAYLVSKSEMPEKSVETNMAATFRY